ncbi:hypothetical protein A2115_03790 [Candidatus Woesebacteria bacterium GWA1_41_8]|jgi:hypothetical protein|uniref:Uncharacterized protein n=1 Tax=Candidatus Woesebacteria bacterium GWA1_41_8 TaxID=1802471 RepID=A0A1F7WJJ2_9BACT|nr:MAG: hypothetical protein A2115_03790 [Candidatus Woesebacteria bacterium GWA1_41_8]
MPEDTPETPHKTKGKIGMDTPDLRGSVSPKYTVGHPKLVEGIEPKNTDSAEIENLQDAIESEGFSKN